ncbi:hypothetical protein GNI_153960 [Gregarina niphandrodes]|uniref:Peptidase A2 domain-containing protein n=1 Tax=Gregarina niphandrodes TaxID=110365 RepID=A0A023AZB0_GRENI|nr:hypothetical protein GNI_153960 [Gregarina niphandrodes]EZG44017.1 hypothetical protein GNI_153960 [Gregarina niphandrodes]|eukprot:XP_011132843.1 hypothetical protein GNI_153960 [Gregarina niphandrodes]
MKDLECSSCHKRGHEDKNCRVRVFDSKYGSVGVEMYEKGNQLIISTPTLNSRKAPTKINQLEEKKRTVEKERRDKKKTSARPDALMEDGELEETTQVAKFADTLGAARVTKGVMLNEVVVEALLDTGATTSIVSVVGYKRPPDGDCAVFQRGTQGR